MTVWDALTAFALAVLGPGVLVLLAAVVRSLLGDRDPPGAGTRDRGRR